jgi:hypothetical protein
MEAGAGVPVYWCSALETAPPLGLLFEPGFNTNRVQVADVVENFSVMAQTVIVEGGNGWAREIWAIGTATNPRLSFSTPPHLTLPTVRR